MAASFALLAAAQSPRMSWLVDLQVKQNSAYQGFQKRFASGVGVPGRPYDASLGGEPPFSVKPHSAEQYVGEKLITAHQIEDTRLLVTRFRNERLHPGQEVSLNAEAEWWSTLKRSADWVILNAPSLEASSVSLDLLKQTDSVVIVTRLDASPASAVIPACEQIELHGGVVLGVIANQVSSEARFFDRESR